MAFTLAQAITEVRSVLNEDSPSYWSDTSITSWIQQGCLDFCEKSLLVIEKDTIALVTSTNEYTTSTGSSISNALRTVHAEYNNIALQRISYEQIRAHNARTLGGSTVPAYYFDHYNGLTFTFYIGPTPAVTQNATLVTVYFAIRTNDITEIPWEYQQTVFLYAAHKAKFRERQYQEALLYYQQYINNISFARQDGLSRGVQPTDLFRIQ